MARDVRAEMIQGAAASLAVRGLEGTPISVVLEDTGAPRGSIYHHFPGGREELITEAVQLAATRFREALAQAPVGRPSELVVAMFQVWRSLLIDSDFSAGCTVAAVAIGGRTADVFRAAASDAFSGWSKALSSALTKRGVDRKIARSFALSLIAGIEGALLISCALRSIEPFDALQAVHIDAAVRLDATANVRRS